MASRQYGQSVQKACIRLTGKNGKSPGSGKVPVLNGERVRSPNACKDAVGVVSPFIVKSR